MEAPGARNTSPVLFPGQSLTLLSQGTETSTFEKQKWFKPNVTDRTRMAIHFHHLERWFVHGLYRRQHFPSDSPVRFVAYSEGAAAFVSLHSDNTVCLYRADGHMRAMPTCLPFMGLTTTKVFGCVVGWGPGSVFALLDSELHVVDAAQDGLDIRVCQAAEHSKDLVTAGVGNVCVWSVMLMKCKVKIQEGLQNGTFTHMALAPPRSDRSHRAFVAGGHVITVVDLDGGRLLEHKNVSSRDITALAYCFHLDCLIIASQDLSIRVWSLDWEQRGALSGHKNVVNSLFYCSELSMLISSSVDCTIRCWDVAECNAIDCIRTDQKSPPLYIAGTRKEDTFISFSNQGVDIWTMRKLFSLHCQLQSDEGAPLRQIKIPSVATPYPPRILCLKGDRNIALVAAETGALLTSFKAKDRILCADYCLHEEILLALTEAGTVLQANTLTNPITLMEEWKGRGQGPWKQMEFLIENDADILTIPGPACCLAIYSYVADRERALKKWRSLQERRGCSHRDKVALDDPKNKFLIFLGQSGGCVSVLNMNNGRALYRMPAHHGQRVTAMQVDVDNSNLLSSGEDLTLVVWRVNPYIKQCLTQQLSLHYSQRLVHLAALGPELVLIFQGPGSSSYSLKCFNLLTQNQTDYQPKEGHSDYLTGLCVLPHLKVFVSSSLDKTVHMWTEENQLLRTLQLNAVPECLAYSGFGGEVFLGIKGNLYKMICTDFLPPNYQQTLLHAYCAEPLPDLPIPKCQEIVSQIKTPSRSRDKVKEANSISDVATGDMQQQSTLVMSKNDLEALLQGAVKSKKGKPLSTEQTRREAFQRYMKLIYGLPLNIKVKLEDTLDQDEFSIDPEPNYFWPRPFRSIKKDISPEPEQNIVEKKEGKIAPVTLVKELPVEKDIPRKPVIVEDKEPEVIAPAEQPKPRSTPFRDRFRTPKPPPPREPSPELPVFLKQFVKMEWFSDLYPDKKRIPSTLSPDDFSLDLLSYLQICNMPFKISVLASVKALHSQGLLQNIDKLYQGLIVRVHTFVRPHMSAVERTVLTEILNLLRHLKPAGYELMKILLTLLAYRELGFWQIVMHMLTELGVEEAEQWLWPELETWESELEDQCDIWKSLHSRAECWLDLWISKYKEHNRYLYLCSNAKWTPPTFSVIEILNYFCSVRKQEHIERRNAAPAGRKNTVLLRLYDSSSSQPILRLGETYSMARIRRPPGVILPPVQHRPFLMQFPNFITLPLPRVTLSPFQVYSEEDWLKATTRRYFIQQQSWVEYYR